MASELAMRILNVAKMHIVDLQVSDHQDDDNSLYELVMDAASTIERLERENKALLAMASERTLDVELYRRTISMCSGSCRDHRGDVALSEGAEQ